MTNVLQDKKAIVSALAGIMNQPTLLRATNEIHLEQDDFPEKFHQIIFGAIINLYEDGVEKISPVEIDMYLSNFPNQYRIYNDNKGIDFLNAMEDIGVPENFQYHYNRIKKFSLLRILKGLGISIDDMYNEDIFDVAEAEAMQKKFEELTIEEMVKNVERKVVELKERFSFQTVSRGTKMSDNVKEILAEKLKAPSYGMNMASQYLNFLFRGARKKKFYLNSGNTGSGKSRIGLAHLLNMCIPTIWDLEKKEWIDTGANEAGLFITTELDEEEIKMPVLCYIAGIDESKIDDANVTEEEYERLIIAAGILEKSNLQLEEIRYFDIQDIMNVVEKNVIKYGTEYVCFDYIHQSLKMLTSLTKAGVKNLREDQIIYLMGSMLKDLCNDHDIWILSATQLNRNYKENGALDETSIRGGQALADRIDAGMITVPLERKEDKAIIDAIIRGGYMGDTPTHSINIYKNRGNRWKMVRVWIKADLGTLRIKDLFCTDYDGNIIDDIEKLIIEFAKDDENESLDVTEESVQEMREEGVEVSPEFFSEREKPLTFSEIKEFQVDEEESVQEEKEAEEKSDGKISFEGFNF